MSLFMRFSFVFSFFCIAQACKASCYDIKKDIPTTVRESWAAAEERIALEMAIEESSAEHDQPVTDKMYRHNGLLGHLIQLGIGDTTGQPESKDDESTIVATSSSDTASEHINENCWPSSKGVQRLRKSLSSSDRKMRINRKTRNLLSKYPAGIAG